MENNNSQNSNEIDLLDVLKKMWQAISKATGIATIFLIKKSLWLTTFIIIGAIVAFCLYKISIPVYFSTMIARANVLDNTFMINKVNELGRINDPLLRAQRLHITDTAANYILALDAYYGIEQGDGTLSYIDTEGRFIYNPKDTSVRRIPKIFYIQAKVGDEIVLPLIGEGIIEALNTNHYIVERNTIRLQQLHDRLTEVNQQLNLLDSVQRVDYFKQPKDTRTSSGQLLLMNEQARQLYHSDILKLHDTKQSLEEEIAEYNKQPITVISNFSALSVIENPLTTYLKFWVPVFFVLGLGFVLVRHFRKRIWTLITEKQ